MKTKHWKITGTLWLVISALWVVSQVGCANLETNAYKTIGASAVFVDGSMNGWGDYVRAGKATPEQEAAVKAAYVKYQLSMAALKKQVIAYKESPTNAPALNLVINMADNSRIELLTLIQAFRK